MNLWIDLDKTIWNCYSSNLITEIWAKQLIGNVQLIPTNSNVCYDEKGNICRLQEGFREFCERYHSSINLNIISAGAHPSFSWSNQPSVKLLKTFGLYNYLCNIILDYKTLKKGLLLKNLSSSQNILVDDDLAQLSLAKENGIRVIDRSTFETWNTFQDLLI